MVDGKKKSISSKFVNSFEISIVFEDEHIIAINKPANMLSVPASSTTISELIGNDDNIQDHLDIPADVNYNANSIGSNDVVSKRKRRFEEWSDTIRNAPNYTTDSSVQKYLRGFTNIDNIPRQEKAFKRYVERNFRELRSENGADVKKIKDDMWDAVSKCDIELHRTNLDGVPLLLHSAFEIIRSRGDPAISAKLWKVHRLDYDTSGILLFAKSSEAAGDLCRQFREKEVRKLYLAEVMGTPEKRVMCINMPLAPHPDVVMKPKQVVSSDGKEALTYMKILGAKGKTLVDKKEYISNEEDSLFAFDEDSIMETERRFIDVASEGSNIVDTATTAMSTTMVMLEPITGRSHQLRVHMQLLGCPILGDSLYAPPDAQKARSRLCLHAHRIRFKHPLNGKEMELTANLAPSASLALDYKAWVERQS